MTNAVNAVADQAADQSEPYAVFVGGYTASMDGGSEGISVFTATGATNDEVEFTAREPARLDSPSFLIRHPMQPWIFAVTEGEPSRVSAFRYGTDGTLELINSVESGGDAGCHLCFDWTLSRVLVAHYGSGSVACFSIGSDGTLSERTGLLTFTGSGPDPERQAEPHAHQVVSVGEVILVPDLGSDAIHIVAIGPDGDLSEAGDPIPLPAGSGPRHLVLAANHLIVACELSGEVWVNRLDAELGSPGASVPSSRRQTTDRVYPSAIASYRDQIVVANRGPNTLAFFELADGVLTPGDEIDCGGAWPRDITIDGDRLWVSNQSGDIISVFVRDRSKTAGDGDALAEAGEGSVAGETSDPAAASADSAGSGQKSGPPPSGDRWTIDFQIPTPDPACVIVAH